MTPTPDQNPVVDDRKKIAFGGDAGDDLGPLHRANDNAPAAAEQAPAKKRKVTGRKVLSAAFNMAAGAVVTAAVKTAVVGLMTWGAAPAVGTLLVSSLAVGLASASFCHLGKMHAAKKRGEEMPKFLSKQTFRNAAFSGGFALIGGALFLGFEDQIKEAMNSTWEWIKPASADMPAVTAPVDVAPPCPSAIERVQELVAGITTESAQVTDALSRAASTDPNVAAQGTKDLAYFLFNGNGGMPKDPSLALQLFHTAADAGNVQAKIDLLYIQYHGLGGVTADPAAATAQMAQIDSPRAENFVKAWGGAPAAAAATPAFDASSIVRGAPGVCLK